MKKLIRYRVGGYVRDQLLGLQPKDCDWVVVGATPDKMRELGFIQVGKDFPVFLHPDTKEEHALARVERKSGPGYHGFAISASPDVTLEQDLQRRDLTINAMAISDAGVLIDPYNGKEDLRNGFLRHVSEAFSEDPVRVLRTARFAAEFNFQIASATHALMCHMVEEGEVDSLQPERVWSELAKALSGHQPSRFIQVLHSCGALQRLFPELAKLDGVAQPEKWHPEIDTFVHVMMALDQSTRLTQDPVVRFSVLMHDLGKGVTPESILPKHYGHEKAGVPLVNAIADRYRIPNEYRKLALAVCEYHLHAHRALELTPAKLIKLLTVLGAFSHPENLENFLIACEADARGRLGLEEKAYPQAAYLLSVFKIAKDVTATPFVQQGLSGAEVGEAIVRARVAKVKMFRDT